MPINALWRLHGSNALLQTSPAPTACIYRYMEWQKILYALEMTLSIRSTQVDLVCCYPCRCNCLGGGVPVKPLSGLRIGVCHD